MGVVVVQSAHACPVVPGLLFSGQCVFDGVNQH
jgi:hypothetical protein